MAHISHMPTEARAAYDAGDVISLKVLLKEKVEFCRSIENLDFVPYADSQRFSCAGDRLEFYRRQESAMADGVISLIGGWGDLEAGRIDLKSALGL